tara:strand:+ start:1461 stop:2339 length:879 start_codon:yes stop_codon:yes gene_type:complete
MWKKLFEKRIWYRVYTERLGEPLIYNFASLFVLLFGNIEQKIKYDLVPRLPYSFGLDLAFKQAKMAIAKGINIKRIVIIEFGVSSGAGLMNLVNTSKKLSKYYNLDAKIVGFDSGVGLPESLDYRDHPEKYLQGDFVPSDISALKTRLPDNTQLYFGDIKNTLHEFYNDMQDGDVIAFISHDFDYYSSTKSAFSLFELPSLNFLPRTVMYFDDVQDIDDHEFAGELLAINEFNNSNTKKKICKLNQLRPLRIFKNAVWISQMYWYVDFDNEFFTSDFHKSKRSSVELTNPYL